VRHMTAAVTDAAASAVLRHCQSQFWRGHLAC
jgi:hypothetical protein